MSPSGREAVAGPGGAAAQEYVALAAAFAARLAARDGDPGADARAIGRAWGTGLATRHEDDDGVDLTARERVMRLLHRLGFSPETEAEPETATEAETRDRGRRARAGHTVLLRTCPLLDAARQHPEVVCQVHLGLVPAPSRPPGAVGGVASRALRTTRSVRAHPAPHTGGMSVQTPVPTSGDVTVVVLAGGTSRRFGSDKLAAPLGGSTVLDTVLGSLPSKWPVVVVGPPRECDRPVTWTPRSPRAAGRSPGSRRESTR